MPASVLSIGSDAYQASQSEQEGQEAETLDATVRTIRRGIQGIRLLGRKIKNHLVILINQLIQENQGISKLKATPDIF